MATQVLHPLVHLSRCTKLGDLENNEWIVALKRGDSAQELYLIRRPAIMLHSEISPGESKFPPIAN
jgi:hypothetical protein